MTKTFSDQRFDRRTLDRHVRQGVVTKEELEEYLRSLPDSSDNAEHFSIEFEERLPELTPQLTPLTFTSGDSDS